VSDESNGGRLESWKEIAAYLRRDVRTVQRWEQTDGLPIHRHLRGDRPIPFAHRAELEAWWTARSVPPPAETPARGRTGLVTMSVVAVAIAAAVTIGWKTKGRIGGAATADDVTSQSRPALELYRLANQLMEADAHNAQAEALLREAVADDPSFASAHILLAWALFNQGKPPRDYLPSADIAERFALRASESERLFIRGSAQEFRNDDEKACMTFTALAQAQPHHYWAVNNVAWCAIRRGDRITAAEFMARRADLRPTSLDENVVAAWANEFAVDNATRARRYFQRALALDRPGQASALWAHAWLELHSAYRKWLNHDVDGALADTEAALERSQRLGDAQARHDVDTFASFMMLTLGRVRDAERVAMRQEQDGSRPGELAFIAYARDDVERARELERFYSARGAVSAILCVRLGLPDLAAEFLRGQLPSVVTAAIEGEMTSQSDDLPATVERLQFVFHRAVPNNIFFPSTETLGGALVREGQSNRAADVLAAAAAEREHFYDPQNAGPANGYFWLRVRIAQAELDAQLGRDAESASIAAELRNLLKHADPDFPILRRALALNAVRTH
jgi:Tfp pilus assembly protein PilF